MSADSFIGDESEEDRPDKAWHEVYRSLQHEVLRKACNHQDMRFFSARVPRYWFRCFKLTESALRRGLQLNGRS